MDLVQKEDDSGNRRKKNNGGASPFLVKTHQMVEEGGTDDVISWAETGKSFVIWKPMEFARDLLPARFKHNNFSSFVRQLNTYGFRKVMPNRWEFANDKFQRGEQRLLNDIHRRKASNLISTSAKSKLDKNTTPLPSTSNSGEIQTSSSTSSPMPPMQRRHLNLSDENKKLKQDNHILSAELLQAKKHCEGLLSFLSKNVNVKDLNVSLLIKEAARIGVKTAKEDYDSREDDDPNGIEEGENVACLKLFGVLIKEFEGEKGSKSGDRKRGQCEERDDEKPMKMVFRAPLVSRKICN